MRERDPNLVKIERRVGYAILINFAVFFVLTMAIGGDALNGQIENGIHYVSSQGNETAVHPLLWYLSATLGSIALGSVVLWIVYKIISGLVRHRPV